ncbi:MAG TPA: phage portal protein [Phycisphaerales bacterium]
MGLRLQAFRSSQGGHGAAIDEASVELAWSEHATKRVPRLEKLWQYYRNELMSSGGIGTGRARRAWYGQGQEIGLPARLRGVAGSTSGLGGGGGGLVDDRLRGEKEVVIENDIAWRVHSMIDFLFARPIRFVSTARDAETRAAVERALDALWETSGGIALLTDMALLGHVFGHVDLLIRVDDPRPQRGNESMGIAQIEERLRHAPPVRVELIEPRRGTPITDGGDYRRLLAYIVRFEREEHSPEAGAMGFLRQLVLREHTPRRARTGVTEIVSGHHRQRYEGENLVADESIAWSGGRVPVVHIQNVSQPFRYEGLSEVEPLIPLQDELNTRMSDRAYRLAMQSFKMYLMRGFDTRDALGVGPGVMITTDEPNAYVQEFGGDASSPSEDAHFEAIRNAMDKVSGVPPLATGVVQGKVGNLSSATALRVTLMGLLARTARKQVTYGRGLTEASRLMLSALDWLGILKTREEDRGVKIDWPDPLPQDAREEIHAAEGKVRLGVEPGRVLEELGYTPRDNGAV